MKILSYFAIALAKFAYFLDPNINVFKDVISVEYEKQFNEFQKRASSLVGVLFSEQHERQKVRTRVANFSPDEKHQIYNRAEELYILDHPGEATFKKVRDIEWYTTIATKELLNNENSQTTIS